MVVATVEIESRDFHSSMLSMGDTDFYPALCAFVAAAVVGYACAALIQILRARRGDFAIGVPLAVGLAVRIAAAVSISLFPFAKTLRGPDESKFLWDASRLSDVPLLSGASLEALTSELHVWLFSVQLRMDLPEIALRIVHVGIGMAGLILLAGAVYDLAGSRAARTASWLLAIEPTSIFFSGVLHKESLMLLAVGIVTLGSVRLLNGDLWGLVLAAPGCFLAVATRPYAGWFLVAGLGALVVHSGLRGRQPRPAARAALAGTTVIVLFLALPTLAALSSEESLERLQVSQEANFRAEANLTLEPVDYSSRSGVVTNLPRRVRDVTLRPYPWQLANLSQQLGFLGTLAALTALGFLVAALVRSAGSIMSRAGPFLYPMLFLLIAYSLSSANAGTSFRYRAQLIGLALCAIVALRQHSRPSPALPAVVLERPRQPSVAHV
jgi:hypothetical protein